MICLKQLKKIKSLYSLLSVTMVVLGLILMICPEMAVEIMYRMAGIVFMILGIVKIMGYFSKDIFQLAFQFDLAIGSILIILGIILLLKPTRMIEVGTGILGILMLADALLRIQTAIDAKKFGIGKWWILLFISLTAAVIGVLLLIMPFKGAKILVKLVGLNICINGVLNFVIVQSTVKTKERNKSWEH